MICAVCHTENNHLTIVCTTCGGFLQTRIENLDLFATAWGIVEHPRKTFHTIAIANHKNYAVILSALSGIAIAFFIFWCVKAAEYTDSLLSIIAAGTITGPFIGVATVLACAALVKISSSFTRVKASYWQMYALTSYALVPVLASAIFILPIELMTFGAWFFAKNPSPFVIKPVSYVILTGLDALFALWSLALLAIGWKTLLKASWAQVILIMACSVGLFSLGAYLVISLVVLRG